ncbi:MAG: PAS domain-containing protein, partial [Acidobacteriota bacterium]
MNKPGRLDSVERLKPGEIPEEAASMAPLTSSAAVELLLEGLPDIVVILDREARILFANRDLFGCDRSTLAGTSLFEVVPTTQRRDMEQRFAEVVSSGKSLRVEIVSNDRLQEVSAWECRLHPASFEDSGVVIACFTDIESRREAEDATRIDAERYRFLTETISDIIWTMDLEQRITYVSGSIKPIVGYDVEEVEAMALGDLLAPESFAL